MLSLYLAGKRRPPTEKLSLLCREADCSADYVLGLTDDPTPSRDKILTLTVGLTAPDLAQDTDQPPMAVSEGNVVAYRVTRTEGWLVSQLPLLTVPVPMLLSPVSAGSPVLGPDDVQSVVFIPLSHLQRVIEGPIPPGRIAILHVASGKAGESMLDTIWPGATLAVDRGPDCMGAPAFIQGEIYLVRHHGGITVKRVWLTDRELNIHADNRAEPPFVIPLERGDFAEIRTHLPARVFSITNPSHT
jgi:hypothetical protein